jgi:cbb3-type cytochrome oxidase maturation protein
MTIIFFLIIVSLVVALGFLGAFVWAVRSGQYDDDYTPSIRMLFDDEEKTENNKQQTID